MSLLHKIYPTYTKPDLNLSMLSYWAINLGALALAYWLTAGQESAGLALNLSPLYIYFVALGLGQILSGVLLLRTVDRHARRHTEAPTIFRNKLVALPFIFILVFIGSVFLSVFIVPTVSFIIRIFISETYNPSNIISIILSFFFMMRLQSLWFVEQRLGPKILVR